jgi:tartrate dehydrogenase/decarboxylase/D-malate dehydrogenase
MLWSVVLMLEHLQLPEPAAALMGAIETSLLDPATRTRDVGGRASTDEVTGTIVDLLTRP